MVFIILLLSKTVRQHRGCTPLPEMRFQKSNNVPSLLVSLSILPRRTAGAAQWVPRDYHHVIRSGLIGGFMDTIHVAAAGLCRSFSYILLCFSLCNFRLDLTSREIDGSPEFGQKVHCDGWQNIKVLRGIKSTVRSQRTIEEI